MNKLNILILSALFSFNCFAQQVDGPIQSEAQKIYREQAEKKRQFETYLGYAQSALSFVPFVIGVAAGKYLENNQRGIFAFVGTAVSAIFSQHMIAAALSGPTMRGLNKLSQYVTSFWPGAEKYQRIETLEEMFTEFEVLGFEYESVKSAITKDTQIFFERLQNGVRQTRQDANTGNNLLGSDSSMHETRRKAIHKAISLMRAVLHLPREVRPLPPMKELKPALEPLLARFNQGMQDDFKRFTIAIDRSAKLGGVTKSVIYLVGQPGTGKTTFVREYTKQLGAHLIEIRNLEEAIRSDSHRGPFSFNDELGEFKTTLFTEKLTGMGGKYRVPKNSVLFLDEIDKFFQKLNMPSLNFGRSTVETFLLQLLDPNSNTITLPDWQIEIDVSGLIVVLAGNKTLPPALRSRMAEFEFPCIPKEKCSGIALKRFDELTSKRKDMTPTDADLEFVKKIGERNPYCGVRGLEFVVEDYVNHKDTIKADWNLNPDFDIDAQYKKHPVEDAEASKRSGVGQQLEVLNE